MTSDSARTSAGRTVATAAPRRGVLVRYRVMAFTTATLLIILVFAGIPLQFAAGRPQLVDVVGTLLGFLDIVYLIVAFELSWKLRIPKWQMALVLLAGTVPFCAFVAERKLTRRYEALAPAGTRAGEGAERHRGSLQAYATSMRKRWLSRRALLLHLEVAVIAPGCVAAGWWQATRALGGNTLSWVYSFEWPLFALLALAGWWQLVHEDPAAYAARKARPKDLDAAAAVAVAEVGPTSREAVGITTARLATLLAAGVGIDVVVGVATLIALPFGRPSGWAPAGEAHAFVYLAHAVLGAVLGAGAVLLLVRVRRSNRMDRAVAWLGVVGIALAGVGGLMSEGQSLPRFAGVAFMAVGPLIAGLGYLIPVLTRRQRDAAPITASPVTGYS